MQSWILKSEKLLRSAAGKFESELGCIVDMVNPGFSNPGSTFWATVANNTDLKSLREIHYERKGLFSHSLAGLLETNWASEDFTNAVMQRQALYNKMRVFMEKYDLIITPTMPCSAFELGLFAPSEIEGKSDISFLDVLAFTYPINLTGQPAASVPAGFTSEGLPVGLQIVGRRFEDGKVLQVSSAFEKIHPWKDKWPSVS